MVLGWVQALFPVGTGVSYPQGGFLLWVEVKGLDSVRLNERLLSSGIQIAPGSLFSASGKYRDCLRINYTQASAQMYEALVVVSREVTLLLAEAGAETL